MSAPDKLDLPIPLIEQPWDLLPEHEYPADLLFYREGIIVGLGRVFSPAQYCIPVMTVLPDTVVAAGHQGGRRIIPHTMVNFSVILDMEAIFGTNG